MKFLNKSILSLFLKSITFKFQVQKIYNDIYNLNGLIEYIPEAGMVIKKFNNFKFLTKSLFVFNFMLFWPIIINPVLSIFYLILNIVISISHKRISSFYFDRCNNCTFCQIE
jgi:hypothetical protein